jgi:hypothetical protein
MKFNGQLLGTGADSEKLEFYAYNWYVPGGPSAYEKIGEIPGTTSSSDENNVILSLLPQHFAKQTGASTCAIISIRSTSTNTGHTMWIDYLGLEAVKIDAPQAWQYTDEIWKNLGIGDSAVAKDATVAKAASLPQFQVVNPAQGNIWVAKGTQNGAASALASATGDWSFWITKDGSNEVEFSFYWEGTDFNANQTPIGFLISLGGIAAGGAVNISLFDNILDDYVVVYSSVDRISYWQPIFIPYPPQFIQVGNTNDLIELVIDNYKGATGVDVYVDYVALIMGNVDDPNLSLLMGKGISIEQIRDAGAKEATVVALPSVSDIRIEMDANSVKLTDILTDTAEIGGAGVGLTSVGLSVSAIDNILDEIVEGSISLRQAQRAILALISKSSGAPGGPIKYRDFGDTKDRLTFNVDGDGNRASVTIDLT